jgi:hypothetical protein
MSTTNFNRRKFISMAGMSAVAGSLFIPGQAQASPFRYDDDNINHIGPVKGYTAQIGTLISMLDWISDSVIRVTKNLTIDKLDHLHDPDSNTIGSLMMHVAATEVIYQDITFYNLNELSKENKEKWGVAMELGPDAREKIKKRDDTWLLSGETKEWNWNNYCKWFHVTEHFANHRGQITWYSKRLPK